jgi:hypothetical protein
MRRLILSIALLVVPVYGFAQMLPQGAHVFLYFPQLADGGDATSKWQTTFTFLNPNTQSPALVWLYTYQDNGSPLTMDLGLGQTATHQFTIPAAGSRLLRSRIISTTTQVGWAIAYSTTPVMGTVSYRQYRNAIASQEMSAQPTLPSHQYDSPANRFLGVAIANPREDEAINVALDFYDSEGVKRGDTARVNVPPLGHTAFVLSQRFPTIGDASGRLTITALNPPSDNFAAWTLGADVSNIWTSLPSGSYSWPISHRERIWLVFLQVIDIARGAGFLTSVPDLVISEERMVNAYAQNGNTVGIYLGLSELISDSGSELAYAIAHEVGHIIQQQNGGRLTFDLSNPEFDADIWGVLLATFAGYDPYAVSGALAKLAMATGTAGLTTQFENEFAADAHKSFNTRLAGAYQMLANVCNYNSEMNQLCQEYKRTIHPHFPATTPLITKPPTQ